MKVFILAFFVILIAVLGLSIGLILGRKRKIRRSCHERSELMNKFEKKEKCENCTCSSND